MTKRKATNSKTAVASFRLKKEAHDRLYENAAQAGLSTRDWLEQAILENKTKIVEKRRPSIDAQNLVFEVNRIGNNLNQIAHHFNSAAQKNKLTKEQYHEALEKIDHLRVLLNEAIRNAS